MRLSHSDSVRFDGSHSKSSYSKNISDSDGWSDDSIQAMAPPKYRRERHIGLILPPKKPLVPATDPLEAETWSSPSPEFKQRTKFKYTLGAPLPLPRIPWEKEASTSARRS